MSNKKSIFFTVLYFLLAIAFCGYTYSEFGIGDSVKFILCYFVENSLSFDNLLMFFFIFSFFKIDKKDQNKILTIGLISAAIFRFLFIFGFSFVLKSFSFLYYLVGAFLIFSSVKMIMKNKEESEESGIITFVQNKFSFLSKFAIIILIVEITDICFAFDSVPAAFGITNNPYIIYAANIFAILGLRSMYFFILNFMEKFKVFEKIMPFFILLIGLNIIRRMIWIF